MRTAQRARCAAGGDSSGAHVEDRLDGVDGVDVLLPRDARGATTPTRHLEIRSMMQSASYLRRLSMARIPDGQVVVGLA